MTATRPTEYPAWATAGTNNTEPTSGQKASGWTFGEDGVSSFDNWWKFNAYQWVQYLDFQRQQALWAFRQFMAVYTGAPIVTSPDLQLFVNPQADCQFALTANSGSAFPTLGTDGFGTARQIAISPGMLFQYIGGAMNAHITDGTDVLTIASGNGTNPRVDLIQCQINADGSWTLNVKQGTPAASPQYPDPDTGFCAIAGVVVNAAFVNTTGSIVRGVDTAAGNTAVLHDQRLPLGVTAHKTMPLDSWFSTTHYQMGPLNSHVAKITATSGQQLIFPCHGNGYTGRLITGAIGVVNPDTGTQVFNYGLYTQKDNGSGSLIESYQSLAACGFPSQHSTYGNRLGGVFAHESSPVFGAGPTVLPSAGVTGHSIGIPVWTSGRRCVAPVLLDGGNGAIANQHLVLNYTSTTADNGATFGPATFWVAGNL